MLWGFIKLITPGKGPFIGTSGAVEIRAMEEHYVGAAGSLCLLYGPERSGRWKNIMLIHQIPCIYNYDPGDQSDGGILC